MSLRKKTITGIYWSGVSQFAQFTSQLLVTVILARLLLPSDFGIIAMANVFINIAASLNERGWASAIIQCQNITDEHCSSVFWVNIVFSISCMLLLLSLSPVIAQFFRQPELKPVLSILTVSFILDAVVIVQRALNMKHLNYKLLARTEIISWSLGGIAGIIFALSGFGVWSLVFQAIVYKIIATAMLWSMTQWKPKLSFSLENIKSLFGFSLYMNGAVVCNIIIRNIDFFLIGKLLGAEALGFYTLAFKLMMLPVRNISWMVSKVMFPALSVIQNNLIKVRSSYLEMVRMVALVTFPIVGGIFIAVPEFIRVFVGNQWQPAILLIRILCAVSLLKSISILSANIPLSQGRADIHLKTSAISVFIVAGSIIAGVPWGIKGVAISYTLANLFWLPLMMIWVHSLVDVSIIQYLSNIWKQFIYICGLIVATGAIKFSFAMSDLVSLFVVSLVGCLIYGGVLYFFELDFLSKVTNIKLKIF